MVTVYEMKYGYFIYMWDVKVSGIRLVGKQGPQWINCPSCYTKEGRESETPLFVCCRWQLGQVCNKLEARSCSVRGHSSSKLASMSAMSALYAPVKNGDTSTTELHYATGQVGNAPEKRTWPHERCNNCPLTVTRSVLNNCNS